MPGANKHPNKSTGLLEARGLLKLAQIRKDVLEHEKDSTGIKEPLGASEPSLLTQYENGGAPNTTQSAPFTQPERAENPAETTSADQRFRIFLDKFITESLAEPISLSLSDFSSLVSLELFNEPNAAHTDSLIRDFLMLNRVAFLKCIDHPNWKWKSLFDTEQWRSFFMEEILPMSSEPEAKVLLARIALRMFSLAVTTETSTLSDDFLGFIVELCRLTDFPAIFMWIFVGLLASDEMQPYLKGGVTQVLDLSSETGTSSLYEENSRYLNTPSLVRFHPEPRELKFTPTTGILPTVRRRKFRTVTVKLPQARRNLALAVDALSLCCELFTSPCPALLSNPKGSLSKSTVTAMATAAEVNDSPASPQPDECSPSSPPPDATGMPQESPASPDHPEMRTVKILDEKLPDRFRVEYKEGMMKMFLDPEPAKTGDGRPTYGTLKRALHALGGWHWLAVCLIDTLKPEESDKAIWWPEFQSVAFFNRNVHIVNAFKKNPVWMTILDAAAAHPDAFLYYSPLLRPVFISLFTHWETSMDGPMMARNAQAREQTLWLLRCASKGKLIHEPYCYLGDVVDIMAAHEISSILASLWKVIKTYLPNPHGLLYIPDTEQDFRAKQMAETDCLLKIRAVLYARLSTTPLVARKFFSPARVPLEESRWYESKESQETASAPAPLDTAHLEKVD